MRPRNFWYTSIKKMIMSVEELKENDSEKSRELLRAIEEAKVQTSSLPNGELRLKAVRLILIEQKKTYIDMAMDVFYDWRTVQNWVTDFINLVGIIYGFKDKEEQ